MKLRNTLMSLILLLFVVQCSGQVTVDKQVKVNGTLYDVPVTLTPQIGDTLVIEAVVPAPYSFNGWSGTITGMQNPQTWIVNRPGTITINYTTALAFEMSLTNSEFIDNRTLEFDVMIKSYTQTFLLSAYQVSMDIAAGITGTFAFSFIPGSSELGNVPSAGIGVFNREIAFGVGGPGNDSVGVAAKRVGRFRFTSTADFPFTLMGLAFDFDGSVNTIITGENVTDITSFGTFVALPERHRVKLVIN